MVPEMSWRYSPPLLVFAHFLVAVKKVYVLIERLAVGVPALAREMWRKVDVFVVDLYVVFAA